jgi:hypothetical protein
MEKTRPTRPISKGKLGKPQTSFRVVASTKVTKAEYIFGAVLFVILSLGLIVAKFSCNLD